MKILTAFELAIVTRELLPLIDCKVNKIHQPSPKELMIEFYSAKTKTKTLKINSGVGLYLTEYKLEQPTVPPGFCMFLRKYLNNSILNDIKQQGFERIVEFAFDAREGQCILICELFSRGNFILTDKNYKVLSCAVSKELKDRTVRVGETYNYPASQNVDLFSLTKEKLASLITSSQRDILGAFIAADIGFGNNYSDEICNRMVLDPKTKLASLKPKNVNDLFLTIHSLVNENLAPCLYFRYASPYDATPIEFKSYKELEAKDYPTFSEALDEYYTTIVSAQIELGQKAKHESEITKLKKVIEEQRSSLSKYVKQYEENFKIGELIYKNYGEVQKVLKEAGSRTASITIDNIAFKVDGKKTIQENAAEYYEKAKEYKEKIPGAEAVVKKFEDQLIVLQSEEYVIPKDALKLPSKKEEKPRVWYEKFRWFITSSGKLAIGGRDATSNEIVVKKHTEEKDAVFHTDLIGSPFFVLKGDPTDQDLEEVSSATASFSRAWKEGLGNTEVYWVKPSQLSHGGSKGTFLVHGKRTYIKNKCELAIGLYGNKIMCGPASAVGKHCAKFVVITPGDVKPSDVAKDIVNRLRIDKSYLDDVLRSLPAGESSIAN